MQEGKPKVVIVAGPNGAGKSTIASEVVLGTFGIRKYVNADTIARGLAEFDPRSVAFKAGRVMLEWIKQLAKQRENFAFETTLASQAFAPMIREWRQEQGYSFHLIFLWLRNSELPVRRVEGRVLAGGHNVPREDIERRYQRGIRNFFQLYQVLADTWHVFDNSEEDPVLIAKGESNLSLDIFEEDRWKQFQGGQNG